MPKTGLSEPEVDRGAAALNCTTMPKRAQTISIFDRPPVWHTRWPHSVESRH